MTDLPNFEPVTLDEAISQADKTIRDLYEGIRFRGEPKLSTWVKEENARRAAAKVGFESLPVEIADVLLRPGDVYNITVKAPYRGSKPRRSLNALFKGQAITPPYSFYEPRLVLRFIRYGANPEGWAKGMSLSPDSIVAVERVNPVPDWIVKRNAEKGVRFGEEIDD